jgi:hypothetical protein
VYQTELTDSIMNTVRQEYGQALLSSCLVCGQVKLLRKRGSFWGGVRYLRGVGHQPKMFASDRQKTTHRLSLKAEITNCFTALVASAVATGS